jgi:hypothetical protein
MVDGEVLDAKTLTVNEFAHDRTVCTQRIRCDVREREMCLRWCRQQRAQLKDDPRKQVLLS